MAAVARLVGVTLDTADPVALADFYRAVTGWQVLFSSKDFVYLGDDDGGRLGFQRVEDHVRPNWPDPAKQFHLDFSVPELERAENDLLALGARVPEFQPGGDKWRVLTDPAGHPFCITNAV